MVSTMWKMMLAGAFIIGTARAQENTFKVFLVGDAGEAANNKVNMSSLQKALSANPNSVVIFLGDNSYKGAVGGLAPYGFRGFDSSAYTRNNIYSQLNTLKNYKGAVYFIPGNHDWWNLEDLPEARTKLKMEENFIEQNLGKNTTIANPSNVFLPKDGDAGPVDMVMNHQNLRLIFIDTYRLIMEDFKKSPADYLQREQRFYSRLEGILQDAASRHQQIILAGHHPVYYQGLDSASVREPYLFSRIKASSIDFPSYKKMAGRIWDLLKKYPGCFYVSGHLHGLQYSFPADRVHYIISGAGSKTIHVSEKEIKRHEPVQNNETSRWNTRGFFEIDFDGGTKKIYLFYDDGQKKMEVPEIKK